MTLWIYQLVESDEPLNPYGVRRMAPEGQGFPVLAMRDGPCCLIRFEEPQ